MSDVVNALFPTNKIIQHDCWASSQVKFFYDDLEGYVFTGITHRNGHRYAVENVQYIRGNELYFRLTPPEDETIPFEDIFLNGNGIRVGRGGPQDRVVCVQHPDIKLLHITLKFAPVGRRSNGAQALLACAAGLTDSANTAYVQSLTAPNVNYFGGGKHSRKGKR